MSTYTLMKRVKPVSVSISKIGVPSLKTAADSPYYVGGTFTGVERYLKIPKQGFVRVVKLSTNPKQYYPYDAVTKVGLKVPKLKGFGKKRGFQTNFSYAGGTNPHAIAAGEIGGFGTPNEYSVQAGDMHSSGTSVNRYEEKAGSMHDYSEGNSHFGGFVGGNDTKKFFPFYKRNFAERDRVYNACGEAHADFGGFTVGQNNPYYVKAGTNHNTGIGQNQYQELGGEMHEYDRGYSGFGGKITPTNPYYVPAGAIHSIGYMKNPFQEVAGKMHEPKQERQSGFIDASYIDDDWFNADGGFFSKIFGTKESRMANKMNKIEFTPEEVEEIKRESGSTQSNEQWGKSDNAKKIIGSLAALTGSFFSRRAQQQAESNMSEGQSMLEDENKKQGINPINVGLIVGGVVVLGTIAFFVLRKRKK
jgi:hypothetical protein